MIRRQAECRGPHRLRDEGSSMFRSLSPGLSPERKLRPSGCPNSLNDGTLARDRVAGLSRICRHARRLSVGRAEPGERGAAVERRRSNALSRLRWHPRHPDRVASVRG
jgi:hypothetical protein